MSQKNKKLTFLLLIDPLPFKLVSVNDVCVHVCLLNQGKVQVLRKNVNKWKENYDLLIREFRKLKSEMVAEREKLIVQVKGLKNSSVGSKVSECVEVL